jgi:hypothetical protein
MTWVAAGVAGAGVIGNLFSGGAQKKRGRRMLADAQKLDPGYQIPKEFEQNLAESENMARIGMPSQEYNLASTNIQRGTQAGLRQLGRMSNPFAGIAGLQRGQTDAFSRLDAQNANVRRQNILQAMGARRDLAGQKLNAQQYQQQKYFDAVNQANAMIGAGMQTQSGALNAAISGATSTLGGRGK